MTQKYDAIVVGVGSVGAFALREFARLGMAAVGIERNSIAHDRSGAGGESRLLRIADVRSDEIEWAIRSRAELVELGRRTGRSLFTPSGVLHIHPRTSPIFGQMQAAARAWNEEVVTLDDERLRERFPRHRVADDEAGVLDVGAGWLRPELSVASAVQEAVTRGAAVRERTEVLGIERHGQMWGVSTPTGPVRARRLVVTPGAWAGRLFPALMEETYVRRIVMTWFGVEDPALFTGPEFPAWTRRQSDGTASFGAPTVDGASVKIALTESYGDVRLASDVSYSVSEPELDSVRALVRSTFNGVLPHVVRASVYMDLFAGDDEFRIRPLDADGTGVLATALSGRGFKIAPALGIDVARAAAGESAERITRRPDYAPCPVPALGQD